jgi:hypothetical protein
MASAIQEEGTVAREEVKLKLGKGAAFVKCRGNPPALKR